MADVSHTTPRAAAIPTVAALVLCVFGLYPLANRLTDGDAVQWYDRARTFWWVIGGAVLVVLVVFATLESAFGLCVGCKVFAVLMKVGLVPEGICLECADISLRRRDLPTPA